MKITSSLKQDLKSYLLKKIRSKDEKRIVEIQTPYPVTQTDLDKIKSYLSGDIEFKNTIDKSLLGGFVLVDGSEKIDASIKGKLDNIVNSILA